MSLVINIQDVGCAGFNNVCVTSWKEKMEDNFWFVCLMSQQQSSCILKLFNAIFCGWLFLSDFGIVYNNYRIDSNGWCLLGNLRSSTAYFHFFIPMFPGVVGHRWIASEFPIHKSLDFTLDESYYSRKWVLTISKTSVN